MLVNDEGDVVDGQGGNMHSINPAGMLICYLSTRRVADV